MSSRRAPSSKELGLTLGFILGRYFLRLENMHYGYWPESLPVDIHNLRQAQALYTEQLLAAIPAEAGSVLDVGCGVGATAVELLKRGYTVDCVSPNRSVNETARTNLAGRAELFECKFQDLRTDRKYDLALFSESFQYMKPAEAIGASLKVLNPGGHILICDFFSLPTPEKSPLGGGRKIARFREAVAAAPLELISDVDITAQVSPTLRVLADTLREVVRPMYRLLETFAKGKYPWLTRALQWVFRGVFRRIASVDFGGDWTPANFAKYKSYRLILLRRRS